MEGLLNYLDEQVEALRTHAAGALEAFDEKSVHQSRVATRRLKAGMELLAPVLDKAARPLERAGKKIRRRLGPLRDLDVMIGLIAEIKTAERTGERFADGLDWLTKTLEIQRRDARLYDHDHGQKPARLIEKFDAWWKLRHDLQRNLEALPPLLTEALHDRFDRFALQADWISGVAVPPEDQLPLDVHQVRIEGKALRYTLEMAEAGGVKLPKKLHKTFKAMQQSLGDWHDMVVIYERTLSLIVDEELALHAPELANATLDLAKIFLRRSITSLEAFRTQWKKSGTELAEALKTAAPLVIEPEQPPQASDSDAGAEAKFKSDTAAAASTDIASADFEATDFEASDAHAVKADEDAAALTKLRTDLDPPPTDSTEPSADFPEGGGPKTPV